VVHRTVTTKHEAELLLAEVVRDIGTGSFAVKRKAESTTFFEIADQFLSYSKARKRSWDKDERSIKSLRQFFGNVPSSSIKPRDIEQYILKRQADVSHYKTAIKPATINRELACLKSIFAKAVDNDQALTNPVKKVKFLKENNIRDRVLSPDEFATLVECAAPHLKPILTVAYHTGMRKNEILKLTWDLVDLEKGWITLPPEMTKTNEKRLVPLNASVIEALREVEGAQEGRVFKYRGKLLRSIDDAFQRARKKTGIDHFVFHDLRHTFVTNMRRAGKQDRAIMAITGHKTYAMLQRYDTVDQDDLKRVVKD
jgi:integrase